MTIRKKIGVKSLLAIIDACKASGKTYHQMLVVICTKYGVFQPQAEKVYLQLLDDILQLQDRELQRRLIRRVRFRQHTEYRLRENVKTDNDYTSLLSRL